jgi:uncharacterized membrane protein YczE
MEERIHIPRFFNIISLTLVVLGVATFFYGLTKSPQQAWANFLLNNYYFLSIAIGAAFFLALQYITQSGWSSGFKRVPEAMMLYIPVAAILFLLLLLGNHHLYLWTHKDLVPGDEIMFHRSKYMNLPFAILRMIIFFGLWILMIGLLRRESIREDKAGGLEFFNRSEIYSKVFIFILGVTFCLFTFDWIMSVEPHWSSTIYALKNFIASFYHGAAMIALIVILLNFRGQFSFMNKFHVHDFTRYVFILSIIWGYFWFAQFMLIWFGNLPEETAYYAIRWRHDWQVWWYVDILLNWFVPFAVLLPVITSRSKIILGTVVSLLVIGFWIDLYLQIMPATVGASHFGIIEIGSFLGFSGLFAFVIAQALSRAQIIPRNHPYLEESLHHEF